MPKDTIQIINKSQQKDYKQYVKAVAEKIKRDSDTTIRESTVIREQIEEATKGKTITVEIPKKSNCFIIL